MNDNLNKPTNDELEEMFSLTENISNGVSNNINNSISNNMTMPVDKAIRHGKLCNNLNTIYRAKNAAYGDSFGKSFAEWGVAAAAIRITDKFNRFINLAKNPSIPHGDESIVDTLTDMANYCLMTILELEK